MTELDKMMDDMLIEIKYLKSYKYINQIKIKGIDEFVNFVVETGELSGCDNKFIKAFAKELRG